MGFLYVPQPNFANPMFPLNGRRFLAGLKPRFSAASHFLCRDAIEHEGQLRAIVLPTTVLHVGDILWQKLKLDILSHGQN